MANPIKSLNVAIRYDNARVLTWEMEPTYNYPADFTLRVENSRAGGPWEVIASDVSAQCSYVDTRRRNWNKWMNEFYRLRLYVSSTEQYVTDPVGAGRKEAYPFSKEAANAITQIEKAIEISGVTGVLLKRKVFGPRCPLCTDFDGTATVNEHCPRCSGTGIDGGFYPGITMNLVKDSITVSDTNSQFGTIQSEVISGRCIAYPWIRANDVWCEDGTNHRYRITACSPSATYKTTDLVYSIKLSRLEYTDVLYTAPVDQKVQDKDGWTDPLPAPTPPVPAAASWEDALETP